MSILYQNACASHYVLYVLPQLIETDALLFDLSGFCD